MTFIYHGKWAHMFIPTALSGINAESTLNSSLKDSTFSSIPIFYFGKNMVILAIDDTALEGNSKSVSVPNRRTGES